MSKSYYEYGRKPHPKKVGRPQKFSDDRLLTLIAVSHIHTVPGLAYWLKAKENTVYYRLRCLLAEGRVKRERRGRFYTWMEA